MPMALGTASFVFGKWLFLDIVGDIFLYFFLGFISLGKGRRCGGLYKPRLIFGANASVWCLIIAKRIRVGGVETGHAGVYGVIGQEATVL